MYQRIIVGTDGSVQSGSAVEHAASLARLTGASLHLVQGCGSAAVAVSAMGGASLPYGYDHREVVTACTAALEEAAAPLRASGLDVDVHVVSSNGHTALCDVATEIDADLIVVGNRGMSGSKRFLGSVPNSVTHHAPCSVLIVDTK
jgi:nucleotide-binding universal stress UspA family protein